MADRTVTYRIRADLAQARAQMAQFGASTRKAADDITSMEKSAIRSRQGLATLGGAAGRVGLVAAAGLGAAAKAAVDWESAFAGVQKTVDATASTSMATLEEQLRSLARTMPATHAEIAATAEAAGQLGIKADDVAGFTETMLQLGETTNLNADEAATSLARFSNIMGTSSSDVGRLGAAVVGLGNNFATTEAEVVEISTRLAAAGNQAGLTEADIFGVAAAMSSVGVEAEAGGTAMSKVFTSIGDAVRSGDGNLQTFAQVAGVTADEFQRLFDANPSEAIGAFVEGMGGIAREGGNTSQIFKDLGLTDQRLMRAILSVGSATGSWAEATALANEEWEKGTALTDEFAKRAGTTASEMTVAWNNVKDAAIDVGAAALPVLSQMASGASAAAGAFQALPGPLKAATGGLLGVTAVLGGGLWFTSKVIGGIASAREALEQLGVSSTKATRGLKGVGIAAAAIGGLVAYTQALKAMQDAMVETLPGAEELESRLISLAETPAEFSSMGLGAEFDSLAESIGRVADKSMDESIVDFLQTPFPEARSLREAKSEIEALDAALAGLVTAGHADVAADAFERLADEYGLTEEQLRQLKPLLTGYNEALKSQENDAKLAAKAEEEHADATDETGDAAQRARDRIKRLNKVIKEQRGEARATAEEFVNLGDAIGGGKQSLNKFLRNMEEQAAALREFQANAEKAGKRGLKEGLIADLQELGPEGARQLKLLANATDAEIKRANRAWQAGQTEVKAYTDEIGGVPKKVTTAVEVNAEAGFRIFDLVKQQMQYLDGLRATTYVDTVRRNRVTPGIQKAAGGYISGPGSATSDSIPAWLSNGEYVIKAAAVQKYGADFLHRVNAMRFADGGMVGRSAAVNVGAPSVSVGGPSVRVLIDGREVRAIVQSEQDAADRHSRRQERRA